MDSVGIANSFLISQQSYLTKSLEDIRSNNYSEKQAIKVGVLVIRGKENTLSKWQGTIDYLTEQIQDRTFELVLLDFENIEAIVAKQEIDFVLVNSGMYVKLQSVYGARRIATLKNLASGKSYTQFGAVIFRRVDRTDIQAIDDLKGKKFMAVSEIAFGGWQMAWRALRKKGLNPYTEFLELQFAGSHDAVVYAVQDGTVDAGTVRTDTLERMAEEGKINLKDFVILNRQTKYEETFPFALSTQLYPEWPFAVMPQIDSELAEQVAIALMRMPADTRAAQTGKYQGWTIPANYEPVHEILKELKVDPYKNWGKITLSDALYQYRYWLGLLGLSIFSLTYSGVYLIQHQRNEIKLRQVNLDLEKRVKQRTAELAQAKQKAELASLAKSQFLSTISHELRTPLNAILGYAQILLRDRSLNSSQNKGIKIIKDSGNHLLTLIDDILDLSKIEAQKLELSLTNIALEKFLFGIESAIRMQAIEKNLRFKYQALTPLPTEILTDEKRLRQVLLNLLSNAIKFTEVGEVTLNVSAKPTKISSQKVANSKINNLRIFRFEVRDTGMGIAAQQLDKIFQAFEQVGEKKFRDKGTGLGLAISQQLVELMGGKLQVSSKLGQGSTFWFEVNFPVLETLTSQDYIKDRPAQIIGYKGQRRQILVVDDKEENRLLLQDILQPLGFEITLAKDGQQAIDLAQQVEPDCILMDLVMPVKTGFEAVQEIREIPIIKNVVIIAISANIFELDEPQKTRILASNFFLPKPIDELKLLAALQRFLDLEWIEEYITQPKIQTKKESNSSSNWVIPSPEEIEILYKLARLGNMKKIRERAIYLQEIDDKYLTFANKLQELARGFQEKAILNLIEQYLP